jgi:hypothetical protein
MRLRTNITRALFVTAAAFSWVSATPSTQIWIPSTDIQKFMSPHVGLDVYVNGYNKQPVNNMITNFGVTVGVLPFEKFGMEIGVDYRDIDGNHMNPLFFNAKIGTPEGAFGTWMPALAIGGYDFGTSYKATDNLDIYVTSYNLVYGLVAKNILMLGRFSVGAYKGAVGGDPALTFYVPSDAAKVEDAGLLVSWDRTLSEISDKLWVAIDFQSGKNGYGALSFGLAWNFASNAGIIAGMDFFNDDKVLKPAVTIQFDANLF